MMKYDEVSREGMINDGTSLTGGYSTVHDANKMNNDNPCV